MHTKPAHFSARLWRSAHKIILAIGCENGQMRYDWRRPISISMLALDLGMSDRNVLRIIALLSEIRIVGQRVRFSPTGQQLANLIWIYDPSRQISLSMVPRTPRVAGVLPQIRRDLKSDRESLRAVAKRYDLCADTVQDIRRQVVPYDAETAAQWRCPTCGAKINSPSCLRCSLI
jgi:hypothetical protein